MAGPSSRQLAEAVLRRYPRSFAEQVHVRSPETPSPLFRLLVLALLMSARIRATVAVAAAGSLFDHGWTTPRRMADAGWSPRTRVLNRSGYARYDERTSRMLGETSQLLLDCYGGDLRRLREEAGHDPAQERRSLKRFKGIGDVGVDIFFREVQRSWPEIYPFADDRVLAAADRLGLRADARALARLAGDRDRFVRLVSGLVRVDLDDTYDEIRAG